MVFIAINLCTRMASKLLPFVIAFGLLLIVVLTPQGEELARVSAENNEGGIYAWPLAMIPLLSFVLTMRVGSVFVWQRHWWSGVRSGSYQPSPVLAVRLLLGTTFVIASTVPVTLAFTYPWHWSFLLVPIYALLYAYYELRLLETYVQTFDSKGNSIKASRTFGTIVSNLIFLFAYSVTIGMVLWAAMLPEAARELGTLSVIVLGAIFWATPFALLFGVIPTQVGLPSLYVLVPLPWILVGLLTTENAAKPLTTTGDRIESRPTVPAHFRSWLLQFKDVPATEPIPVYLIAAEGGGLRAALWTSSVLANLETRNIFAYSGVSGGAMGVAVHAANIAEKNDSSQTLDKMHQILGVDYLSPVVARLLITEPIRFLFGNHQEWIEARDRAFEMLFERNYAQFNGQNTLARPFLDVFSLAADKTRPFIIVNATDANTGRRIAFSNVKLDEEIDAFEILGSRYDGLPVSTVMHFSARFPVVSPPANLLIDDGTNGQSDSNNWLSLVDGGYFENSGISEIAGIYKMISRLRDAKPRKHGTKCVVNYSQGNDPEIQEYNKQMEEDCIQTLAEDDEVDKFLRATASMRARLQIVVIVISAKDPDILRPFSTNALRFGDVNGPLRAVLASREIKTAQVLADLRNDVAASQKRDNNRCLTEKLKGKNLIGYGEGKFRDRLLGDGARFYQYDCDEEGARDSLQVAKLDEEQIPLAWNLSAKSRMLAKERSRNWESDRDIPNSPANGWWFRLGKRKCADKTDMTLVADDKGQFKCIPVSKAVAKFK